MSRNCIGCGAYLQSEDKKKIGYVPQSKNSDAKYCERCFKIMHYNEKLIMPLKNINTYILKEIQKNQYPVFFLVDFLTINEETIRIFQSIQNEKILIISKLDIIPKSIKKERIGSWLARVYGINEDIQFISTKKKIHTKLVTNRMIEKQIKQAYILGYTNSGKSTFINQMCLDSHLANTKITTSLLPNTTVDFIHIQLGNSITIIDSPGFTYEKTIYQEKEFNLIEKINPKHFLKPITYQVKPITSILIENKIRLNSDVVNSFTFYMSNALSIRRVFEENKEMRTLTKSIYKLTENQDVVIKGIGFVHIKKACHLSIYIEDNDFIEIRDSMF